MKKFEDVDLEYLIDVLEDTKDIFIRIPKDSIKASHNLKNDLGLDSLGKINLFYEISDRLETEDDEEETLAWKEVSDILSYIHENRN